MKYLNESKLLKANSACLVVIFVIGFTSCKKDEIKAPSIASLTLVNTITGGSSVKLGNFISATGPNNFSQFGFVAGDQDIYVWPFGDSSHPYFTYNKLSVKQGESYSLFLGGIPTTVDGIIVKENIPYRSDSSAGVRFINLSPNSKPLNITLSTSPTVNQVSGLMYKQYTDFISYPANYNATYAFQIREASGALITTFQFTRTSIPRFANVTLVIRGMVNGSPSIGVTMVRHDR